MSDATTIEWTDATWNPVRGCSIVSKGCTNCYAMRQAHRASGAGRSYEGLTKLTKGGPVWTGQVKLVPELLDQPLRWRRPRRIFVNSMSDLFHEDVPDDFIADVLFTIKMCEVDRRGHVFQLLTKRADRMLDFMVKRSIYPMSNLWLGVSVEDQAAADERIPPLLETPAAVRWISAEPLLGPVKLPQCTGDIRCQLTGIEGHSDRPLGGIDWVVVGGESGPGARPMHPDWARSLRDQCAAVGVSFFFKQWGAWSPVHYVDAGSGHRLVKLVFTDREKAIGGPAESTTPYNVRRVGKKAAGRELDGRTHDDYPNAGRLG